MIRKFAADDYDAIADRMRELRPEPTEIPEEMRTYGLGVPITTGMPAHQLNRILTKDEALQVAMAVGGCKSRATIHNGPQCQRDRSQECILQNRCATQNPIT